VPGSGPVGLVDWETLRDQLDGRAHVFDTRTRADFTGEVHEAIAATLVVLASGIGYVTRAAPSSAINEFNSPGPF
jgi:hypothetical protein